MTSFRRTRELRGRRPRTLRSRSLHAQTGARTVSPMQQLVLQFPARSIDDYDAMVEMEEALIDALGDRADVDGHDFGQGEMNVFIWTEDAPRTFGLAQTFLAGNPLMSSLAAGYREQDGEVYVPLWPEDSDAFVVL
jgi:hypothetical protein